jgi:hypothetical protein
VKSFKDILLEGAKGIPLAKIKKTLDNTFAAKKGNAKFKSGKLQYYKQFYNEDDEEKSIADATAFNSKVVKAVAGLGFKKTSDVPNFLKNRFFDQIWVSPDGKFICLTWLNVSGRTSTKTVDCDIFDVGKVMAAGASNAEKLRKWVTKNSSFMD